MLKLCVSQQKNNIAYVFSQTGQRVFSIEEAQYYVFHNWRLVSDDFLCDSFVAWVAGIGLSFFSSKIKEISRQPSFSLRILGFLGLTEYFGDDELNFLKSRLEKWEARQDYEKLKERADYFTATGEPIKAIPLYKQAIALEESEYLLNNLGVAQMQVQNFSDAVESFKRAISLSPSNFDVLLGLIESLIRSGNVKEAGTELQKLIGSNANTKSIADISYLQGLLAWNEKRHLDCLTFLKEACKLNPESVFFVMEVASKLTAMRQFESAINFLESSQIKDYAYYAAKADVYKAAKDFPKAIKAVKKAIQQAGGKNTTLYTKLASFYRQDYNLPQAESSIQIALEADPGNELAKLELARIKKAQGRIRDYQSELNDVLGEFKKRYRENFNKY